MSNITPITTLKRKSSIVIENTTPTKLPKPPKKKYIYLCIHNRQKALCKDCGGNQICIHNRQKSICKDCGGSQICIHNRRKNRCKDCGGNDICIHNKLKNRCKDCGGNDICPVKYCDKRKNKKYNNYCMRCCIHLFPDTKIPRNYKTKENAVVTYIKETYPNFDWIVDKKIIDGCSHRRPDIFLDMGSHIIIIEIDEYNHVFYNKACEEKRIHQIVEDTGFRHVVFIRFNPDGYIDKSTGNKVKSCWSYTKTGLLKLHDSKIEEWNCRLKKLSSILHEWLNKVPKDLVEIIYIFQ